MGSPSCDFCEQPVRNLVNILINYPLWRFSPILGGMKHYMERLIKTAWVALLGCCMAGCSGLGENPNAEPAPHPLMLTGVGSNFHTAFQGPHV
jgi:hypothetical protein